MKYKHLKGKGYKCPYCNSEVKWYWFENAKCDEDGEYGCTSCGKTWNANGEPYEEE